MGPARAGGCPYLADAGVDVEVDDSKASGEYANGMRLDPGADLRASRRTNAPPTGSQGDAVAADAVCPRPDASLPSEEHERRVLGRSRAGNAFYAHGCDRRARDDSSEPARCERVSGRRAERRRHERRDQQCAFHKHLVSVCCTPPASRSVTPERRTRRVVGPACYQRIRVICCVFRQRHGNTPRRIPSSCTTGT